MSGLEPTPMTEPKEAVIHPLVLLSTVDHYNRLNAGIVVGKRVVGVLLGTSLKGTVDVTNSFALPFEEDPKAPDVFYLDHNFLESMYGMFRKVNARERIVGWYSTGPRIRSNDLDIHVLFRRYATHPVYCIIEVEPKEQGLPTSSYTVAEEVEDESSQPKLTFRHLTSRMGALEAEEIGVEHLLRDLSDTTVSTLSTQVSDKTVALKGLQAKLGEMQGYLEAVVSGKLPINHNIMYRIQDIFNLLSLLDQQRSGKAMTLVANDNMMTVYMASMIRAILAIHDLINNKQELKRKKEQKEKEKKEKEEKEKEEAEKKEKEKEEKEKEEKEKDKEEKEKDKGEKEKADKEKAEG